MSHHQPDGGAEFGLGVGEEEHQVRTVDLGDHSAGSAAATIREVGELLGYEVSASGPASFRLGRRVRRGVRRVELVSTIELASTRKGLSLSVDGPVDERLIEQLEAQARVAADSEPAPQEREPARQPQQAPARTPTPSLPPVRPGVAPSGFINSVPGMTAQPADDAGPTEQEPGNSVVSTSSLSATTESERPSEASTPTPTTAPTPTSSISATVTTAPLEHLAPPSTSPAVLGPDLAAGLEVPPTPSGPGSSSPDQSPDHVASDSPGGAAPHTVTHMLRVTHRDASGQESVVSVQDGVVVGRGPALSVQPRCGTPLVVTDDEVSKSHVAIWLDDAIVVQDLHSTNGTSWIAGGERRTCDAGRPTRFEIDRVELVVGGGHLRVERVACD